MGHDEETISNGDENPISSTAKQQSSELTGYDDLNADDGSHDLLEPIVDGLTQDDCITQRHNPVEIPDYSGLTWGEVFVATVEQMYRYYGMVQQYGVDSETIHWAWRNILADLTELLQRHELALLESEAVPKHDTVYKVLELYQHYTHKTDIHDDPKLPMLIQAMGYYCANSMYDRFYQELFPSSVTIDYERKIHRLVNLEIPTTEHQFRKFWLETLRTQHTYLGRLLQKFWLSSKNMQFVFLLPGNCVEAMGHTKYYLGLCEGTNLFYPYNDFQIVNIKLWLDQFNAEVERDWRYQKPLQEVVTDLVNKVNYYFKQQQDLLRDVELNQAYRTFRISNKNMKEQARLLRAIIHSLDNHLAQQQDAVCNDVNHWLTTAQHYEQLVAKIESKKHRLLTYINDNLFDSILVFVRQQLRELPHLNEDWLYESSSEAQDLRDKIALRTKTLIDRMTQLQYDYAITLQPGLPEADVFDLHRALHITYSHYLIQSVLKKRCRLNDNCRAIMEDIGPKLQAMHDNTFDINLFPYLDRCDRQYQRAYQGKYSQSPDYFEESDYKRHPYYLSWLSAANYLIASNIILQQLHDPQYASNYTTRLNLAYACLQNCIRDILVAPAIKHSLLSKRRQDQCKQNGTYASALSILFQKGDRRQHLEQIVDIWEVVLRGFYKYLNDQYASTWPMLATLTSIYENFDTKDYNQYQQNFTTLMNQANQALKSVSDDAPEIDQEKVTSLYQSRILWLNQMADECQPNQEHASTIQPSSSI